MLLIFRRFNEFLTLNIDRKNKKLKVRGTSTNFKEEEQPWKLLWDRCEHHKKNLKESNIGCEGCSKVMELQDKETEAMTDEQFRDVFKNQMKVYLYDLIKWE